MVIRNFIIISGLFVSHFMAHVAVAQVNLKITRPIYPQEASAIRWADNTLTATNTIDGNTQVDYSAGEVITLGEGFEVKEGSSFHAYINTKPNTDDIHKKGTSLEVTASPNPSNGIFKLYFSKYITSDTQITILDSKGTSIMSFPDIKPEEVLNIDLSDKQQGIYFIQVISNQKTFVKKIFLNK